MRDDTLPQYLLDIALLLPLDIRVKFIWNCLTQRWGYSEPSEDNWSNMLWSCFYFDESPEGYHFWFDVYLKYVIED